MFCPSCGFKDTQSNQFCRACGVSLNLIRSALEKPDNITQSAILARDEIGRAIAAKIRETRSITDLAEAAEDLFPEIEKFLESPEEKRMRRVRNGTIISSIGLGTVIAFSTAAIFKDADLIVVAALGAICFFIGLGFMINGLLFTVPKKTVSDKSIEAESQRQLDAAQTTNELNFPESNQIFSSVTEHTTHQLKPKESITQK